MPLNNNTCYATLDVVLSSGGNQLQSYDKVPKVDN